MKALTNAFFDMKVSPILLDLWLKTIMKAKGIPDLHDVVGEMRSAALNNNRWLFFSIASFLSFLATIAALALPSQSFSGLGSVLFVVPLVFCLIFVFAALVDICETTARGRTWLKEFLADCHELYRELYFSCIRPVGLVPENELRKIARKHLADQAKKIVGLENAKIGSPDYVLLDEEQRSEYVVRARTKFGKINALFARFNLADEKWDPELFREADGQIKEVDAVIEKASTT